MAEETKLEERKKGYGWRIIGTGFVALVVIAALVICLAPIMDVTYAVQDQKPVSYRVTDNYASGGWNISLGSYAEAFVSIENTDTVPATFVVDFAFTTLYRTHRDSDRAYILPGESKTLTGLADISWGEDWQWSRTITPGTKTTTETRSKKVTVLNYLQHY